MLAAFMCDHWSGRK